MGTKKKHLNVVVLSSQCVAPNAKTEGKENKSAVGMQHTRHGIFSMQRKSKLDLFMQSLKKIGNNLPKIESEKTIYNVSQGP